MVEQIHEILGILVKLHSTSEIKGVLPTTLLHDIAKLTKCVKLQSSFLIWLHSHYSRILEKVFTLLKQRQSMGKIKQLFEQRSNTERLKACQKELNDALEMFKVHLLEFI
jgi:aminoglycoside N3'-acetyltransferase